MGVLKSGAVGSLSRFSKASAAGLLERGRDPGNGDPWSKGNPGCGFDEMTDFFTGVSGTLEAGVCGAFFFDCRPEDANAVWTGLAS